MEDELYVSKPGVSLPKSIYNANVGQITSAEECAESVERKWCCHAQPSKKTRKNSLASISNFLQQPSGPYRRLRQNHQEFQSSVKRISFLSMNY